MKIYHTTRADGTNQIGADEWNEEHYIEEFDEFIYEYCLYPTRKRYNTINEINGAYTLSITGDTVLRPRFNLVIHLQSKATDSNPCQVLLRISSDSNPDKYDGNGLKITSSGTSVIDVTDGGIILCEPIERGSNLIDPTFYIELNGWIRDNILAFEGKSAMLYPSLDTRIIRAHYTSDTNFTTTPTISIEFPANSYTKRIEYELYRD